MIKTTKTLLIILFLIGCSDNSISKNSKYNREIDNLVTFAKSYGLVKYFYPNDESSNIDWDLFSIYGSRYIRENTDKDSINYLLSKLYGSFASTVSFNSEELKLTNPRDSCTNYAYWQHQGLGLGSQDPSEIYYSVRINAITKTSLAADWGKIVKIINAENVRGQDIVFKARVRLKEESNGTGHLRLKITDKENNILFFDGMSKKPITDNEWEEYSIKTKVDTSAYQITFGFSLKGKGILLVEDYTILNKKGNGIPEELVYKSASHTDWVRGGSGYEYSSDKQGETEALALKFIDTIVEVKHEKLFDEMPEPNQTVQRKLGAKTFCILPISICTTNGITQPRIPENRFNLFQEKLNTTKIDKNSLDFRLGNVIILYNIVEHFFPYLHELRIDWDKELRMAISKSFKDKNLEDHIETLEQMVAALKDGHGKIIGYQKPSGRLPIAWETIENKLVITNILNDKLPLKLGDVIEKINGEDPNVFMDRFRKRISAGTKGWLNERVKEESVIGKPNDKIEIMVGGERVALIYNDSINNDGRRENHYKRAYTNNSNNMKYINLEMVDNETLNHLIPEMLEVDNLIFDLRGYPNITPEIISYLLKQKDTASSWMKIPKYIYPNQKNIAGYIEAGWELEPKKPYLGDKNIVFLTNGKAISYSESLLGYVKSYKLGTIIGEPTAGANGNFNKSALLGDLVFVWTGMDLVQPNGIKVFAKGILPDIEVHETIDGIRYNKDVLLDFATNFLQNHIN